METVHKLISIIGNLLELVNVHIIEGEHNLEQGVTEVIAAAHAEAVEVVADVKAAAEGVSAETQPQAPAVIQGDVQTDAPTATVNPAPVTAAAVEVGTAEAAPATPATPAQ